MKFDTERQADDALMTHIVNVMVPRSQVKLEVAAINGKGGWWDDERVSVSMLEGMLEEAHLSGDWVSVLNYAAMLHYRETHGA